MAVQFAQAAAQPAGLRAPLYKSYSDGGPYGETARWIRIWQRSKDFDNIVKLGNDVLPILQEKIEKSPNNGLTEYILAIAIESITKTNLKNSSETTWQDAKGFTRQWRQYLESIPSKVDEISSSR